MSPITICFVTREYPPETGYGGIGSYYADLARALTERGFRVVVLSEGLERESFLDDHGIHVYRVLPRWSVSHFPVLWRLNRLWKGYRLAVAIRLRQLVREYGIDIIETPELHAETFLYDISSRSHPRLVVRMHSGTALGLAYNKQPLSPRFRINLMLEKMSLRQASVVTAPSTAIVKRSQQLGLPIPCDRVHIFPNPVNTEVFSPDDTTVRDKFTVLFVGRLEWWKGPDILIEALPEIVQKIPDIVLRFVGKAPIEQNHVSYDQILLNKVPTELRGHVEFLPPVARGELPDLYRRATIVAVPSRWESFGYVCAEAMACGTPVIVNNRGGLPEIVGDAGMVIEPENPEALASAIITLINDPDRRDRLSAAGRKRIVDYCDAQRISDDLAQLYESIVSS